MSQGSAQGKRSFYKLHVYVLVIMDSFIWIKNLNMKQKTKTKQKQNHSSL